VETSLELSAAGVTSREAEVLEALGARLTNAEISERLFISVRTVESHVSSLLRKLAEPDRRALAVRSRELFRTAGVPFPTTLAPTEAPFVGRQELLERLDELASAVESGVRRAALIIGEAGIGKTRLVAEHAARRHGAGAVVLHGRCEADALIPYQALVEAVRVLAPGVEDVLMRPAAGLPGDRYRAFEEFDHVLGSCRAPVTLVIDDVQWMDPSGVRLLAHVLHRSDRSPLLALLTARPEATEPRHPITQAMGRAMPTVERIALGGISLSDAEQLASSLAAVPDPSRLRTAWERTSGNPFLLAELLRHGATHGDIPPSARDAIVRRVAGLGPSVYETMNAAAVMGDAFRPETVVAAIGRDNAATVTALERAFAAGIVVEDAGRTGHYRFAHALVREALLDEISPDQRSRLHLKVAEALGSRGAGVTAEVAQHLHAALPAGDPDRARRAALAAFDQAMDDRAYEVAAMFAGRALDAIAAGGGDDADRADTILRRGTALVKSGNLAQGSSDCRLALEEANRRDLPRLRAAAALGWADAAPAWGRQPQLRAAIQHALAAGVDDLEVRAQLKARLAQQLYYEDAESERFELSREAVTDARASGRPDTLASVLATTHMALWEPAHLDERTDVARQIVAAAQAAGQPELEAQGLGRLAVDLLETGDLRGADRALAEHALLAQRLHQRLPLRDVELWAAMRSAMAGDLTDAADRAERARDLGEAARDPGTDTVYWVQRYWIALESGHAEEMDAVVEPCQRITTENTDVPAWRAALAMLHARRGDHDQARRHYEPLAVNHFEAIPRDVVWLNAMTYLAEVCAVLGDTEHATTLLDALAPYASRVALIDRGMACKGSVQRFLGLLAVTAGDPDRARRHLTAALEWHETAAAKLLATRTRSDLAALGER
jgi:DNA-binding CsgD family transcriptional regulator